MLLTPTTGVRIGLGASLERNFPTSKWGFTYYSFAEERLYHAARAEQIVGRLSSCFPLAMKRKFVLLVADDDPNDLQLLNLAIRHNGINVEIRELHDGTEVIAYLQGTGRFAERDIYPIPDLLLLDLKMPRMNGLDVLKWLREHPECARIPTVMLSNSDIDHDIDQAYRLGVNTYFIKPGDYKQFIELMGLMLDYWAASQRPRVRQPC